jgi:hypothetical protein
MADFRKSDAGVDVVEYNGDRDVKSMVEFIDSVGIPISQELERARDEL